MIERSAHGFFGGLWVFPGGAVEEIDRGDLCRSVTVMPDSAHDLLWRAAALRETVEEVGLAVTEAGIVALAGVEGEAVYARLRSEGLRLDGRRLRLLSQWVTPAGAPTRFDTRFYLVVAEEDAELALHPQEVIDARWVTPADALGRMETGEWSLVTPTVHHLRWLAQHSEVDAAWEAASPGGGQRVEPVIEADGSEVRVVLPLVAELP